MTRWVLVVDETCNLVAAVMSDEDSTRSRSSADGRHNKEDCLMFGKVVRAKAGKEPMGYVSFRSEAYISLGMVKTRSYSLIGLDSRSS